MNNTSSARRAASDPAQEWPRTILDLVRSIRTFTSSAEQFAAENIGPAAQRLHPVELSWVIDRLDDVRISVTTLLGQLDEPVEQAGADAAAWRDTLSELDSAGHGLYQAIDTLDPGTDRGGISGCL